MPGLSKFNLCGYSQPMPDKLDALLNRLKAHQCTLVMTLYKTTIP